MLIIAGIYNDRTAHRRTFQKRVHCVLEPDILKFSSGISKKSYECSIKFHERGFKMNNKIAAEIKKKVVNGRLPCPVAREIAQRLSVPYREVGKTADELKVKIARCELGCF